MREWTAGGAALHTLHASRPSLALRLRVPRVQQHQRYRLLASLTLQFSRERRRQQVVTELINNGTVEVIKFFCSLCFKLKFYQ